MTNKRIRSFFLVLAVFFAAVCGVEQENGDQGEEQEPAGEARMEWYQDAKFGMFIHWGPYSEAGVEASWPIMSPDLVSAFFGPQPTIDEEEYVQLPKQFNPVEYDPEAWVDLAREAGMRYMVITTKHHDGFCMFDALGTDYKITRTPYGRDIVAELADACAAADFPLGFYYSPPDMHHPGYRDTSQPATENWPGEPERPEWGDYLDYMESHLRSLLTEYGDVALVWFDGLFQQEKYDPERFHRLLHELSPETLVNDRLGPDRGDFVTPEQFFPTGVPVKRSEPTPEVTAAQFEMFIQLLSNAEARARMAEQLAALQSDRFPTKLQPDPDEFQPWETCMTMNNTWAYNPRDENFKSTEQLIKTLVEVVSRGGNFLLNVGPTPEGTIQEESQERLRAIGAWLRKHGEAIYGTTYGPLQSLDFARTTKKGNTVYLHVLEWPEEGELALEGLEGTVADVFLLVDGSPLEFSQEAGILQISVPETAPDEVVSVLALEMQEG